MQPITIAILTALVLGVLLVVLAVIAVVVLLPAVRRALADRPTADAGEFSDPDVSATPTSQRRATSTAIAAAADQACGRHEAG